MNEKTREGLLLLIGAAVMALVAVVTPSEIREVAQLAAFVAVLGGLVRLGQGLVSGRS